MPGRSASRSRSRAALGVNAGRSLRGRPTHATIWRTGGTPMAFTRPQLDQFAADQRPRFEQLLKEFVEIPSVSADPDRKADLERCAELGLATVRAFGGRAEIHRVRSEEHTSELQSLRHLVCRLLLE